MNNGNSNTILPHGATNLCGNPIVCLYGYGRNDCIR